MAWDKFCQAMCDSNGMETLVALEWQTKEQWQVLFTPEYVRRACQFFCPHLERVIEEWGGYIEGHHHNC